VDKGGRRGTGERARDSCRDEGGGALDKRAGHFGDPEAVAAALLH
jgi:hypothetical protein